MRRFIYTILLALLLPAGLKAQTVRREMTELAMAEPSDSVLMEIMGPISPVINDYSMIGVSYGVTFSTCYFSPSKHGGQFLFQPTYLSVMYTKHSKLFDVMPNFALQIGAAYGHEGYRFETDPETGRSTDVDGAVECTMEVLEIPAMAQFHTDIEPLKIMADAGIYGGWRKSVSRSGPGLDAQFARSFRSYENRWDYGFQGGVGFGIMLDPIEIHFNCLVRWSWSSLYRPDYNSPYYYRYAYPLDIMATVGIHFQLGRRYGRTTRQIRQHAYDYVYGKTEYNTR